MITLQMASHNTASNYSFVWKESFWFPVEYDFGWKDLENQPGSDKYYPDVRDLHWSLVLSLVMVAVRYLWEIFLVVPIGIRLGLSNKQRIPVTPVPQLEAAFKRNRKPDNSTLQSLAKQTDLTERQIEIWFRKRRKQTASTPMQKFRECSWHFVFYTLFFIYGIVVLSKTNGGSKQDKESAENPRISYLPLYFVFIPLKPYSWKTALCWEGWPKQHVSSDIYWYYLVELGFYWGLIWTLFKDNKRKDFVLMVVHHAACIILLYFSWILNLVRIGSLVACVQDSSEAWLALAKMSVYIKNKLAADIFFGIFVVIWTVSRLIVFPYVILYSTLVEPFTYISTTFGAYIFFNIFLGILQSLNAMWSYFLLRLAYRVVSGSATVEDTRSESEDNAEDTDDEEEEWVDAIKAVQNGINGTGRTVFSHDTKIVNDDRRETDNVGIGGTRARERTVVSNAR